VHRNKVSSCLGGERPGGERGERSAKKKTREKLTVPRELKIAFPRAQGGRNDNQGGEKRGLNRGSRKGAGAAMVNSDTNHLTSSTEIKGLQEKSL